MNNQEKLISILKDVFMLDKAELDFGIYKIMNQKRLDIEQFLYKELLPQIKDILAESVKDDKKPLQIELEKATQNAIDAGINPETSLKVIEIKEKLKTAADITDAENEVFSHLATFFKRYFDNGDFIAMRRYKEGVYAIPYAGEEVKLHWANADQYYIKTSEYLKNYRFKLQNEQIVCFLLIEASTEQNNNKAQTDKERKFQLADLNKFPITVQNNELVIPFLYEKIENKNTQKELNENAFETIKKQIPHDFLQLLDLKPTEKDKKRTLLQKHLQDYTARNSFDYFIHKDLGAFLMREMDFYIKNEILFIDDLNTKSNDHFIAQLTKIKATKNIAHKIITFLAQLEDFQKKLWCKKKFIVETNYCITIDRIPKELYPQISNNQKQIKQWINLFAIDEIKHKTATKILENDIVGFSNPMTTEFLNQNQFLLLDTAHFDDNFKWDILTNIHHFDKQNNGLIINSENFQALALLQARYQKQIKTIYIDPPYNTGNDGFAYKDNFKSSSWLTFMENRVNLSRNLLKDNGVCFTSLDDNEISNFKILSDSIFGNENFVANSIVINNRGGRDYGGIAKQHEYLLIYSKSDEYELNMINEVDKKFQYLDEIGGFNLMELRNRNIKFNDKNRKNLCYPFFVNPSNQDKNGLLEIALEEKDGFVKVMPAISQGVQTVWRWGKEEKARKNLNKEIFGKVNQNGGYMIVQKYRKTEKMQRSVWDEKEFVNERGTEAIKELFDENYFSYPKSVYTIKRILQLGTDENALILDYFAGSGTSGHAVINLNREDGGERKYILVEMGEYFETVTKPRIMKVIYSKDWKEGKPLSREGISHCFKYLRLESYEDTLNNLVLARTATQQTTLDLNAGFKEGYMLNYMLDVESRESLLNLKWFVNPFECYLQTTQNNELQTTKVDMIETFNYLLGVEVITYGSPREHLKIVIGTVLEDEGKVLIIWRDCDKINNEELNAFLEKSYYSSLDREFSRIYVNGDNNIENLRTDTERWKVVLIEEAFKELMF